MINYIENLDDENAIQLLFDKYFNKLDEEAVLLVNYNQNTLNYKKTIAILSHILKVTYHYLKNNT